VPARIPDGCAPDIRAVKILSEFSNDFVVYNAHPAYSQLSRLAGSEASFGSDLGLTDNDNE